MGRAGRVTHLTIASDFARWVRFCLNPVGVPPFGGVVLGEPGIGEPRGEFANNCMERSLRYRCHWR